MNSSSKEQRATADQAYRNGVALFQERRYADAINELRLAENLFRSQDAGGHPFNYTLENGISGLANVLQLLGKCHRERGDMAAAIAAFETSMINGRFERSLPYRAFRRAVEEDLAYCYAQVVPRPERGDLPAPPETEPSIDLAYRFPFSLPQDSIPLARLYELTPQRFPQFQAFYDRARRTDIALRRAGRKADDATMRTISIGIWSVLVVIWLAYSVVVVRNLINP